MLPLFPLPNVVLFPGVFLPLHIFEPRYRAMTADALHGDRIIGMTLLMPGYEADYQGRPAVYPVGCAGVITHAEQLPDGRSNVVLRGIEKFRILDEDASRDRFRAHPPPSAAIVSAGRYPTAADPPAGSTTKKIVFSPGTLSTQISPSFSSTIERTIESPRPAPLPFVVKNGSKICFR